MNEYPCILNKLSSDVSVWGFFSILYLLHVSNNVNINPLITSAWCHFRDNFRSSIPSANIPILKVDIVVKFSRIYSLDQAIRSTTLQHGLSPLPNPRPGFGSCHSSRTRSSFTVECYSPFFLLTFHSGSYCPSEILGSWRRRIWTCGKYFCSIQSSGIEFSSSSSSFWYIFFYYFSVYLVVFSYYQRLPHIQRSIPPLAVIFRASSSQTRPHFR